MRAGSACLGFGIVLLAGCVTSPAGQGGATPPAGVLARADAELGVANYRGALELYDEFLRAHPDDAASPRARGTRAALDHLVASRVEIGRLREALLAKENEVARARHELAARTRAADPGREADAARPRDELVRLRRDLADRQAEIDRLRAEVGRLRADLERLRSIDLRPEPPRR